MAERGEVNGFINPIPEVAADALAGFTTYILRPFPLTAVAVRYALAISALVMAVDKGFWFIAAALRTDWTMSFRRSVELCFGFWFQHNCNVPTLNGVRLPCKTPVSIDRKLAY